MPRIKDVAHVVAALTDTIPIDRPTESAAYHTTVQDIINLTPAAGKTIVSVDKVTVGLVDTYTITYTDLSTYEIVVTNGANGANGANGQGVASGGTVGQVAVKKSNTDYDTEWKSLAAADVGAIPDTLNGLTDLEYSDLLQSVGPVTVLSAVGPHTVSGINTESRALYASTYVLTADYSDPSSAIHVDCASFVSGSRVRFICDVSPAVNHLLILEGSNFAGADTPSTDYGIIGKIAYNTMSGKSYFRASGQTIDTIELQAGVSWTLSLYDFQSWVAGQIPWSKIDKTDAVASSVGAASATHATIHQTGGTDPINMHAFHGVLSRATVSPLPTSIATTTFTLACATTPMTYYMDGVQVVVSADVSTVLAGTAGFYFIYWDDAAGTLANSTTFPGVYPASTNVLVASVWWNGVDLGLVNDERHGYDRDQAWHTWAHRSVGTRWSSGLDLLTLTGTGATATMTLGAGEILDEDITFTIPASASFDTSNAYRLIYQTGATSYAFVSALSTVPFYRGANNRPNVVNSTGYALTQVPNAVNRYVNFFVYATTDLLCPIYICTETVTNTIAGQGGYTSTALARAVPWPNLAGVAVSAEMKPLYRVVVRADGVVQAFTAADDYRSVSSLPQSAGTSSTTASAVSFAPAGNIASVTVQQAIEELDLEKLATVAVDGTTITGDGTAGNPLVAVGGGTVSALFEVDINGDMMPKTDGVTDEFYELDVNSDIMPKA